MILKGCCLKKLVKHGVVTIFSLAILFLLSTSAFASDPSTNLNGYGFKIFQVESGLYPFVQVYVRSFDQNMNPLINLNERNVGIMVQGKPYAIEKKQYMIQSIRNRQEAIRSILVLDTSKSMAGEPYDTALKAVITFINAKRPQDQVAIIALDNSSEGYEIISNFESDAGTLGRRLNDVRANGKETRLYDGIGAAIKMAATADSGGTTSGEADYVASTSIIVFSDGKDEGSALTRDDLMNRINQLENPVPIYSLAYSKVETSHLKNLQALSSNSFGKYYEIEKAYEKMNRSVEDIQNIMQNDYVLTFRAYLPVDGEKHIMKIGIEYPTGSAKYRYQTCYFEAITLNVSKINELKTYLNNVLQPLSDSNPYMLDAYSATPGANMEVAPAQAPATKVTQ